MSAIKVSVIIPVYNVAPYLSECLDSLISQTLKEIEIICVDDGSTDGSLDILRRYEQKDSRIRIITQRNSGAGVARNTGLKVAQGEYLSILDGDDFFNSRMLETAYARGKELSAEIVMFRFHRYDHQAKREYNLPHMMKKDNFPQKSTFCVEDMKEMGVNFFFAICGWTWDKLFLRSYIEKLDLQFQDTRIFNDMYFTYSALLVAQTITYLEDALVCQRVNRPGAVSRSAQNNWRYVFDSLGKVRDFLVQKNKFEDFKQYFATYALHMVLYTFRQVAGTARIYMQIVCMCYGLHYLGLDLSYESVFLNNSELEEAKKYFCPSSQALLSANISNAEDISNQISNLQIENERLKREINNIHQSISYRVGRVITFFPRKIRGGIRCFRENGLKYTLHRIREKLFK